MNCTKLLLAFTFGLAIAFGLTSSGLGLVAQETAPAATEPKNPNEGAPQTGDAGQPKDEKSLDELLSEWDQMDAHLKKAESDARAEGALEPSKVAYRELVDEAHQLIAQIERAAVDTIAKDPKNDRAGKILAGIMVNTSLMTDGDAKVLALADKLLELGVPPDLFEPALKSNRLNQFAKDLFEEIAIRAKEHQANDLPRVKLITTKGDIVVELFENEAPNTVANFISLVKAKFYDSLVFHRVIEGFMAQAGCPKGDGTGGPGYRIKCECYEPNARKHFTGSVSMAHAGRDTGGSQFFLTFVATTHLNGKHTVFGRVISGFDTLERITRNATNAGPIPGIEADKIISAEVLRDRGHEYKPAKIDDPPAKESAPGG